MRLRHAPISVVVAVALLLGACRADEPAGGAGANGDGAKQADSGGDGDGDKPAGKKSKSKQKTEPKDQPEPSFEGTVVSVKVSNGDVTFDPTEAAVGVGEKLRIEVTSDAADEARPRLRRHRGPQGRKAGDDRSHGGHTRGLRG